MSLAVRSRIGCQHAREGYSTTARKATVMTETMVREHATAADTDTAAAGFVVHVDVLRTLLAGALVAASKDDTQPALCAGCVSLPGMLLTGRL